MWPRSSPVWHDIGLGLTMGRHVGKARLIGLALWLVPMMGWAAGSPLVAAFEQGARAVEAASRKPDAALAHWLGVVQWRDWIDADRQEKAAQRIARAAGTSAQGPLVRLELARLAAERGAFPEARDVVRGDGWLAEGLLVCEHGGAATRLSLEPWAQPLPLDHLAGLARGSSCRLRVPFELAAPDRVLVGFDGPPGTQLRADGERVLLREAEGPLLPDGELVELDLVAGRHVLEVQFADAGGAGLVPIYLRVLPRSGPLRGTTSAPSRWLTDETVAATPGSSRPPRGLRHLEGTRLRLQRLAAEPSPEACDAALLLERAPPDPFCGSLILRRDDPRALTRRHSEPAALFFFAQVLDRVGQGVAAAEILRFALKGRPDFPEARVAYLGLLVERGAARAATDEVRRLLEPRMAFGRSTVQGILRILSLGGLVSLQRGWLEPRLRARLDPGLGLLLLERLEADGDVPAILELAARLRRAQPWLVQADLAEARARSRQDPTADVRPLLAVAARLGGSLGLDVAEILRAAGRDAEALRLVDAALDLNPASERARLLALALGRRETGLDAVFGPLDVAASRQRARDEIAKGGTGLVGLFESQRRVVAADGTSRSWSRVVLARLGGPRDAAAAWRMQVHASSETLALPRLTILKRDGGAFELPSDRVETFNEAPEGMVDESEELSVPLEDLEPGDVMVIEALRVARGLPGQRERPADLVFFRREVPVLESHSEVVVPRRWVLKTGIFSKHDRLRATLHEGAEVRTFEVTASGLPAWEEGDDDYAAWSTYAGWSELGYDYGGRFARALASHDDVVQLAARLTAGLSRTSERVAALHRWVADNVRYFGVELGEHAYVPYPVETVLHRGYGDCKDKSALLASLLAAVGVHAVPVLVASADGVELDPSLPMIEVFNHLLLFLPEDGLFLDPTLSGTPAGYLPAHVAGRAALVIDGSTAPRRLPEQDPGDNVFREQLAWESEGSGRFRVDAELTLTGELAFPFREWAEAPATQADGLADLLRAVYPTLEVERADARLDVSGRVPVLTVSLRGVDALLCSTEVLPAPAGRRCSGFARDPQTLRETVDAWGRGFPYSYHGRFRLPSLPAEEVTLLPPFRRVATARAQLRVETRLEGGDVTLQVAYRQDRRRLPAKEAETLRAAWVAQPIDVAWERRGR